MLNFVTKLFFVLFLLSVSVFGLQEYQDNIPNGYNVELGQWPGVGHYRAEGRGKINDFGRDFRDAGFVWTKALCMMDSDQDDYTNGEELGDPDCTWVKGVNASNIGDGSGVTHPGFPNELVPAITTQTCGDFSYADTDGFSIRMNVNVPTGASFACQVFDFGTTSDLHLVKFDPLIETDNDYVKEIMVYECPNGVPSGNTTCNSVPTGCTFLYSAAWGGSSFCLPSEAGFRVEPTTDYFMLVRYDNPDAALVDTSGVNFTYTATLRDNDAGIVQTGVIAEQLVVEGDSIQTSVTNICPTACLNERLPITGITLFASRFSAHNYATRINSEIAESGENMELIASVPYYDLNIRETTAELPYGLVKDIQLITSCFYKTQFASDIPGGDDLYANERCENFIAYYPKIDNFHTCNTIINDKVNSNINGTWRDGRATAQCGNEYIDIQNRLVVPTCNDLAGALGIVQSVATGCNSCEDSNCKEQMLSFVASDCVEAMGYDHVLSYCEANGVSSADCTKFNNMFVDCEGICAIGLGTVHCENVDDLQCGSDHHCVPVLPSPDVTNPNVFGFPVIEAVMFVVAVVAGIIIVVIFVYCAVTNKKKIRSA